ncbi:GntR family transcriptional regulator [Carnobacterium iners]|uniref:GntR family transcriptional regulator n=1 Tax=Carnobacterium iners TaxID=1073423 RepID=A0A1X7NB27_9LACT|nr:GntR family transcriptional regulator [Carnobacterium iners]SEK53209.1 GntR family transcriptional regulator [Carnobacterium iners]SMH34817.1 GntR family transcriptional regulator [Carnobacterium iners]
MIEKNSATPLYVQLVDILIADITQKMQPNDKMMSEREICQLYDVSRTTVRLALAELENSGYIYKRHGRGTFVSGALKERKNLMDNYSFTDHMRQLGKEPKTIVVTFELDAVNPILAKQLGLKEGEEIYRLERIRLANAEPMMFEISYIPAYLFPNLTKEKLSTRPLYEIFKEDYNQTVKIADEEFSASLVTDEEAEMLEVAFFSSCLRIQRTSYNKQNIVIEYTSSVARSDQFVYNVRHSK